MVGIYSTHRENITESDNIQNMGVKNAKYLKYVKSLSQRLVLLNV